MTLSIAVTGVLSMAALLQAAHVARKSAAQYYSDIL